MFLFVLFVMCLGAYAAISTLARGRDANVITFETMTPTAAVETAATGAAPLATDTPIETPTPHSEVSTPIAPSATPVAPATQTSPPQPTGTPSPNQPGDTATPTPIPPAGEYLFGTVHSRQDCASGGYIRGVVYGAGGSGLPGINVHLYNNQGYDERAVSKSGAIDMGAYDFPMGPDAARFYLEIVDSLGNPRSAPEVVDYAPRCTSYVDWQSLQ